MEPRRLELHGLKSEVLVNFDIYGIPHINAENIADLNFVHGYVKAGERLWQMDYMRRAAAGRLAEILGADLLAQDFEVRMIGFDEQAEKIWESASAEYKCELEAFAAGVNWGMESAILAGDLPEEFEALGYEPEPWRAQDSVLCGRPLSWLLSSPLLEKLQFARVVQELGLEKALDMCAGAPVYPKTSAKWDEMIARIPADTVKQLESLPSLRAELQRVFGYEQRSTGSNAWAVSGAKTATGAPLLAGDPHLDFISPPIWYEVHLTAPGLNVTGVTAVTGPEVLIGHNERIAWSCTTVGFDVLDIYMETLDADAPDRYIHKGESVPFEQREITLKYTTEDGLNEDVRTLKRTVHGPVIFEDMPGMALSFRWTGFEPSRDMECFAGVNRATNLEEFKNALELFEVGAQNFIYADVDGNIFYQATGKVPIRNGVPFLPMDGSSGEFEWTGYIPYEHLPKAENPPEGFVVSANNRPADESYPYYIGYILKDDVAFDLGGRAWRISNLLNSKEKLTFEDMQCIQSDVLSPDAELLLGMIERAARQRPEMVDERLREALDVLLEWDKLAEADRVGSSIFHMWLKQMAVLTLKPHLGDELFGEWTTECGAHDTIIPLLMRIDRGETRLDWLNPEPDGTVTLDEAVLEGLKRAVEELEQKLGPDMTQWRWDRLHRFRLVHPLGVDWSPGPFGFHGSMDTVDHAEPFLMAENFDFTGGPSMRMVVDMRGRLEHAQNVIPGGQSGSRSGKHYNDQLPLWLENEARPMFFSQSEIEENAEEVFRFVPKCGTIGSG